MRRLRIGRIPFGNLFPIFYALEHHLDCSRYEFIDGVPSELNLLLRRGDIDLSPSSSVEYLRHKEIYHYIDGHSISSQGRVGSIFLFTRYPIESLNGRTVYVTSQSATSVELLRVIASEFYSIDLSLVSVDTPQAKASDSYLLIGDDALRQFKADNEGYQIYDLGELWHRFTGLPFVFALWIVRKDNISGEKTHMFEAFKADLDKTKSIALDSLRDIAPRSPLTEFMDVGEVLEYWKQLDYDLTEGHKKGLMLFDNLIARENR